MRQPLYYPGMAIDSNYFNMSTSGSNVSIRQVFEDAGFFAMAETSCYWFWDSRAWAEKSYKALELALLYASDNPPASYRKIRKRD